MATTKLPLPLPLPRSSSTLSTSTSSLLFSCSRHRPSTHLLRSSSSSQSTTTNRLGNVTANSRAFSSTPLRAATLIPRPRRPYRFTQLVQLSDGSTYAARTTSPHALHRSQKDTRNHVLWQPSERALRNVEVDEAGKLAAFRGRFGRGWDVSSSSPAEDEAETEKGGKTATTAAAEAQEKKQAAAQATQDAAEPAGSDPFDSLADLLSGYAEKVAPLKAGGLSAKEQAKKDKKKK